MAWVMPVAPTSVVTTEGVISHDIWDALMR